MDVIILAGAKNGGILRAYSDSPYEAGIRLGTRTILDYVIEPLTKVAEVKRIAVVGPEECVSPEMRQRLWRIIPQGNSMLENLRLGLGALAPKGKVMVTTADIPLLSPEALTDFLARCQAREADAYYPLVRRKEIETRYPGVKRTYFTLREGVFTGGNIFLLSPEIVERHTELLEKVIALRKKPLQTGRLLGLRLLLKFILGRLAIAEVEGKIEQQLKIKGAAVVTPFAEIGVDVDKPSDLELVKSILRV